MIFLRTLLLAVLLACLPLSAYELSGQSWENKQTSFHVQSNDLGTNWTSAFISALNEWSARTSFTFSWVNQSSDPCLNDDTNGIGFKTSICGTSFGNNTLAVTLLRYTVPENHYIETDIVFNENISWSTYSGPLQTSIDFKRVAVHELGHALGLNHENTTPSIMNSVIGSIESPLSDDIAGVSAIYGTRQTTQNDFDANQQTDILLRNTQTGVNWLYLIDNGINISGFRLNTVSLDWKLASKGDFNADGTTDIIWRNQTNGRNWVYLMNAGKISTQYQLNQVADQNWKIAGTGDFDGNGTDDILWFNHETGISWIYGVNHNGTIKSSQRLAQTNDSNWKISAIGDLNNDQHADIVWRHQTTGLNWIYIVKNSKVSNSRILNRVPDLNWEISHLGDLDANGTHDVIWRHQKTGVNFVYLMNADLSFTPKSINRVSDLQWYISSTGQFDKVRGEDILWRNQRTGQFWLYSMQGNLILSSKSIGLRPSPTWLE